MNAFIMELYATGARFVLSLIVIMLSFPIEAKSRFTKHPLEGTWEMFESVPSTRNFPAIGLDGNAFFEGQRIILKYNGPTGSQYPGRDEYVMTLLPPYDSRMCDHTEWNYLCESERYEFRRIPANPVGRDAWLEKIKINEIHNMEDYIPYGFKPGRLIFNMTLADKSETFSFYLVDKNTIVNNSAYFHPKNSQGNRLVEPIMQKFRRVKLATHN